MCLLFCYVDLLYPLGNVLAISNFAEISFGFGTLGLNFLDSGASGLDTVSRASWFGGSAISVGSGERRASTTPSAEFVAANTAGCC